MTTLRKVLLFIGIALHSISVQGDPQPVDTLFQIDLASDENGGSGSVGRQRLQSFLQESETLAQIGSQLVDDYDKEEEATRLLKVFVGELNANERSLLKSHYVKLLQFLRSGAGSAGDKRPYLLCHHTWLKKKTLTDSAYDKDGEEFPAEDLSGRPTRINEVRPYMVQRSQSAGKTPYWSVLHDAYLWDYSWGGSKADAGYCSVKSHRASTSELLLPATITLCPQSFDGGVALGGVDMKPLRSEVIPKEKEKIPKDAQMLDSLMPTSITLFHEMFHLVVGNAGSAPPTGEVYKIIDMGKMKKEDALRNPETWSVLAVAYSYTRNVAPVDGKRVEFYGYFTTRG